MIDFILRPFRRNFGKDKRFYAAIDDMFGFIPNNIELYKLALIHKSASVTTDDGRHINNERLEYLGDAIIESVSSDYLFIEFPDRDEGFLTQLRSKMVSRQMLNEVAKRIGLDDYVISHTSNNSSQKHIYGDAFEAMMGAIYLDQGYEFVNRLLINKIFVDYIKVDSLCEEETDFKSRLIEWCQKNHHSIRFETPRDRSYSSSHPSFYCKVLIDNIEVGYGAGDSKKEAEQRAALSVAQGVSDADCTKLMDKLDSLEMNQLKSSREDRQSARKEERKESKRNEKREDKVAEKEPVAPKTDELKEDSAAERAVEPATPLTPEPTPVYDEIEEPKKVARKRTIVAKSKADKEAVSGKTEKRKEPKKVKTSKPQTEPNDGQSVAGMSEGKNIDKQVDKSSEKPSSRRGRPRKSAAEKSADTKAENHSESKPAASRRGRPRKKSVTAEDVVVEPVAQTSAENQSAVE